MCSSFVVWPPLVVMISTRYLAFSLASMIRLTLNLHKNYMEFAFSSYLFRRAIYAIRVNKVLK